MGCWREPMSSCRKDPPTEELGPLRQRIKAWRVSRAARGPMPGEIWESAVVLARVYGVCRIARAVDLDYESLRLRMARAMEKPGLVKPTFVELPATAVPESVSAPARGASIEISSPDGSRMRINLESGRGMEAAGIVAAFLGSRG